MRKLAVVAFLVLSLMTSAIGVPAAAQDATPAAGETQKREWVTVETIAETTSGSGTLGMTLYQITIEPDVVVEGHDHYGSVTWYVDSGTLELTVLEGEVWVRCASDCLDGAEPGHTTASGDMLVPVGATATLETGDWAIQHAYSRHTYANPGDIDTVIVASTSYDLTEPIPAEATPAAQETPPPGGKRVIATGCKGACM